MISLPRRRLSNGQQALLLIAGFFLIVFLAKVSPQAFASTAKASRTGEHVLSVYDDGHEKGILTKAGTLRDALAQAKISLGPNDITEPSLDEKLVASNYSVTIYRARSVLIVDGESRRKVLTAYRTPQQIAQQAKITLHDEDKAELQNSQDIVADGAVERLVIQRATPFTLVLYGQTVPSYTMAKTVGEMMKQKKITLGKDDGTSLPEATPITAGMTVSIWRNGVQTVTQSESIPFDTKQIKDADQPVGYKKVDTPGKNGEKMVTYQIMMQNGIEVSRTVIQSVDVTAPVQQVETVGAKFTNTFSGDFAGALARLRSCEGSYTSNTGNGYYGAYQYDLQTWGNYQGYPNAAVAPPAVQDQKVWETYQRRGWQPWPSCSRSQGLQDIYR